jgi:hypothetical protein
MNTRNEEGEPVAGDLLIGATAIRAFLVYLGMPKGTDPYYLKRSGWPMGNTAGSNGKIIASKRRLIRHIEKLTRGPADVERNGNARASNRS